MARRAELDQGSDGSRLPSPERRQPADRRTQREEAHARDDRHLAHLFGGASTRAARRVSSCSTAASQVRAYREFLERVVRLIPQHETVLATNAEVEGTMAELTAGLEKQIEAGQTGAKVTVGFSINGIQQRFKKLRYDENLEFSVDASAAAHPSAQLNRLATDGPNTGFHVICAADNVNNVNRYLSRKALGEFDLRVLFQMSANDSALLIDSPKAGNLGLHRAIFYNEQEGYMETFRPYAMPDGGWLEQTGEGTEAIGG